MNRLKRILEFIASRPTPIIIGATVLAFLPLFFGSLTERDHALVWNEPSLSGFAPALAPLGRSTPPHNPLGHYRPISTLSLGLEVGAGEQSALLPRVSNFILLALIAALVFQLLRSMKVTTRAAAWAVAVFAAHPTHVEVVATLAGRVPLSAHVFALSAVFFSLRKDVMKGQKAVIFAFIFLAVLCQRSALLWCLFPGALRLAEGEKIPWRRFVPRPLLAGALTAVVIGMVATGRVWPGAAGSFLEAGSWLGSVLLSLAVIGKSYPSLLFIPSSMTPDPVLSNVAMQSWLWGLLGLAVVGGLVFLMRQTRGKSSLLFLSAWLFLAGVLPALPILDGDLPSQTSAFAATLALPFFLAFLLMRFEKSLEKYRYVALLPVLLAVLTGIRSFAWKNEEILLASVPGNQGPWSCRLKEEDIIARTRADRGRAGMIRDVYADALQNSGDDQRLLFAALRNEVGLGQDLVHAQDLLKRLTAERPSWPGIDSLRGRIALGRRDQAAAHAAFVNGRDHDPRDADSRLFLGMEYAATGANDLAEALWREGLRLCIRHDQQPTAVKILTQLGHLVGQRAIEAGLFQRLCRRQLAYSPEDSEPGRAIRALMAHD